MLKKVAVTGGISSGKTTVCQIFQQLGAHVVYADNIVHQHLEHDKELEKKLVELLGPSVVVSGKLNRARIANRVFDNPKRLKALEELTHPLVLKKTEEEYERIKDNKDISLYVVEIPLVYEIGYDTYFDDIITVIAPDKTAWERFREKTGSEREDFNRRMARQLTPHEKAKKSQYVIENSGTLEELKESATKTFQKIVP